MGELWFKWPPNKGLALAKEIGMILYRSKYAYDMKFGRNIYQNLNGMFKADSYFKYKGNLWSVLSAVLCCDCEIDEHSRYWKGIEEALGTYV